MAEVTSLFSQEKLEGFVKQSIETNNLDPNAKLAIVGLVNDKGSQVVITTRLFKTKEGKVSLHAQGVIESDWHGNHDVEGKILFQVK
jgi:hypothetical protein